MIDSFIRHPAALERQQKAPLYEERCRFLHHLAAEGHSFNSLRSNVHRLRIIAENIDLTGSRMVGEQDIVHALQRWRTDRAQHSGNHQSHSTHLQLRHLALRWLRFMGRLETPAGKSDIEDKVFEYSRWMREEQGFAATTIYFRSQLARHLLAWIKDRGQMFLEIRSGDIDAYILEFGQQWSRVTMLNFIKGVRPFLRHAANRGWCTAGLDQMIETPRVYLHETIPQGMSWEDVKRLVASASSDEPADIRDRAIILLLATYGLRAGEVAVLRLEDIDWTHNLLTVRRPKPRRWDIYPLARTVGDAIARYIETTRPQCSIPEIFLMRFAPRRAIKLQTVSEIVFLRAKRLEINAPHCGARALRHACAAHLLAEGFSMKEIGDHLGHRNPDTTRIYAKIDIAGLREVAALDLEGLP